MSPNSFPPKALMRERPMWASFTWAGQDLNAWGFGGSVTQGQARPLIPPTTTKHWNNKMFLAMRITEERQKAIDNISVLKKTWQAEKMETYREDEDMQS